MKESNPFYLIKHIHDKFEAKGNSECQKVGLTISQFRILVYLTCHQDRTVTQREMELAFKVSHPTITGILRRMESNGFISTKLVQSSKMQKEVFLSDKGREALSKLDISRNKDDKALLSLFNPQELDQLENYLNRILDYLSK